MNIYVGNLTAAITEDDLIDVFQEYGEIKSVKVIKDQQTGNSRGFGFVEMKNDEEGLAAIEELNEAEFDGNTITVNQAKPKTGGNNRGGGGGHRGGNNGGGYRRR